jgi:hypothetical protein
LYPSGSVLKNITTDENGHFSVSSMPLKSYYFDHSHGTSGIRTREIQFNQPVMYIITLIYDESGQKLELETTATQLPVLTI